VHDTSDVTGGICCTDGTYLYTASPYGLKKYSQDKSNGNLSLLGSFSDSLFRNKIYKNMTADKNGNIYILTTFDQGGGYYRYLINKFAPSGNTFVLSKTINPSTDMNYSNSNNAGIKVDGQKMYFSYKPHTRPTIKAKTRYITFTNRMVCYDTSTFAKLWTTDETGGGASSEYMAFDVKNDIITTATTPSSPDHNGDNNLVYPQCSLIVSDIIPVNKLIDKLK
jgi:hypothetical protein